MRALNVLPNGLEEIVRIYGDPDRDGNGRADPDGGRGIWCSATCRFRCAPAGTPIW